MEKYIKIDSWVDQIIVDPLGKGPIKKSQNNKLLLTDYEKTYPIINGIYDLRLLREEITHDQKIWFDGQKEYEKDSIQILENDKADHKLELKSISKVYQQIPIIGRCLDVGGNKGTLREFLKKDQEYVSVDPFLNVFSGIEKRKNLIETYKSLKEPMNFICCNAEYLPFKSNSFDTVHMRSVVDHFLNPESAFLEAFRVLKSKGNLIVGLYVYGGKNGKVNVIRKLKDYIKNLLPFFGINKYTDHHTWHPTFEELKGLIIACGFRINKVYWQTDTVCYIKANK